MARILIVDDEEQVRKLLRRILVKAGHDVHTAGDVQSALEMCVRPSFFDLVISDVVMPGGNGHELARHFAVRCPNGRVILMSGFDPGCDECPYGDRCRQISKPFVPKEVIALVSEVLAKPPEPSRYGCTESGPSDNP